MLPAHTISTRTSSLQAYSDKTLQRLRGTSLPRPLPSDRNWQHTNTRHTRQALQQHRIPRTQRARLQPQQITPPPLRHRHIYLQQITILRMLHQQPTPILQTPLKISLQLRRKSGHRTLQTTQHTSRCRHLEQIRKHHDHEHQQLPQHRPPRTSTTQHYIRTTQMLSDSYPTPKLPARRINSQPTLRQKSQEGVLFVGPGCVFRARVRIHSCRYSVRNVIGGTGCLRCARRAHRLFLASLNIDFTHLRRGNISTMITHVGLRCGAPLHYSSIFISGLNIHGRNLHCVFSRTVRHGSSNHLYFLTAIRLIDLVGNGLNIDRSCSHTFNFTTYR